MVKLEGSVGRAKTLVRRIMALIMLVFVVVGILLLGTGFFSGNSFLISAGIYMQIFNIFLFLSFRFGTSEDASHENKDGE